MTLLAVFQSPELFIFLHPSSPTGLAAINTLPDLVECDFVQ